MSKRGATTAAGYLVWIVALWLAAMPLRSSAAPPGGEGGRAELQMPIVSDPAPRLMGSSMKRAGSRRPPRVLFRRGRGNRPKV